MHLLSNLLLLFGLVALIIVALPWSLPLAFLGWRIWRSS